jgi:hypothetical protein
LARLDASLGRPWTRATLEAIEARPGVRAADLMLPLSWSDLHQFKLRVRKLKTLGLTLSLRVGYSLSPRGAAYLRRVRSNEKARDTRTTGRAGSVRSTTRSPRPANDARSSGHTELRSCE